MSNFEKVDVRYVDVRNEKNPSARRTAIGQLCAEDASYLDPLAAVQGHAAINATIGAVQSRFADFAFRLAGPVDGHHDQCRFGWEFGPVGAQVPIGGFDVAVLSDDGKIQAVYGFLDRLPAS
jgi:SnoaL-like protein